ncbi:MAG: chemotaxis protein CheW [Burkholderiales bacterium]
MRIMKAPASSTAAVLADEFDRSFVAAPPEEIAHAEKAYALRLGDDPYAIRAGEIAGLFRDHRVVQLPSREPALLGVAGFRGRIAPVYDLAVLLGYPARPLPRWLLLAAGDELALAVTAFEGQLSLSHGDVAPPAEQWAGRSFIRGAVRANALLRPIVDTRLLVEEIRRRAGIPRTT